MKSTKYSWSIDTQYSSLQVRMHHNWIYNNIYWKLMQTISIPSLIILRKYELKLTKYNNKTWVNIHLI